jgi:hypothetical protein
VTDVSTDTTGQVRMRFGGYGAELIAETEVSTPISTGPNYLTRRRIKYR